MKKKQLHNNQSKYYLESSSFKHIQVGRNAWRNHEKVPTKHVEKYGNIAVELVYRSCLVYAHTSSRTGPPIKADFFSNSVTYLHQDHVVIIKVQIALTHTKFEQKSKLALKQNKTNRCKKYSYFRKKQCHRDRFLLDLNVAKLSYLKYHRKHRENKLQ